MTGRQKEECGARPVGEDPGMFYKKGGKIKKGKVELQCFVGYSYERKGVARLKDA